MLYMCYSLILIKTIASRYTVCHIITPLRVGISKIYSVKFVNIVMCRLCVKCSNTNNKNNTDHKDIFKDYSSRTRTFSVNDQDKDPKIE